MRPIVPSLLCCFLSLMFVTMSRGQSEAEIDEAKRTEPIPIEERDRLLQQSLQLFQLDASTWSFLLDNQPVTSDEFETIGRILQLLPRFTKAQRIAWSHPAAEASRWATQPADHRGQLVELHGRVLDWQVHSLPVEASRRYGFSQLFVVRWLNDHDQQTHFVCASQLPTAWSAIDKPSQHALHARCHGLFLKSGESEQGSTSGVFAADYIAWTPLTEDRSLGITADRATLGQAGFDVNLLTSLTQRRPIGHEEQACFYEMLANVPSAAQVAESQQRTPRNWDIATLLQHPETQAGERFTIQGTARRALRIEVADRDVATQYHLDHYYEVEVLVPLDTVLELTDRDTGVRRSYRSFPMTLCARELPPGMPEGDFIQQAIRTDAFFMKLWSYRSQFMDGEADDNTTAESHTSLRQVAPLLITDNVTLLDSPATTSPHSAWLVVIVLVALITLVIVLRWQAAAGDKAYDRWKRRQLPSLPPRDRHTN